MTYTKKQGKGRLQKTIKSPENSVTKKYGVFCCVGLIISWLVLIKIRTIDDGTASFLLNTDLTENTFYNVTCSEDYKNYPIFSDCTPISVCGRCVKDGVVHNDEINSLKRIVENGLKYGGSNGGASILDLHSGAMSKEEKFVNIYKYLDESQLSKIFLENDVKVYQIVKNRILQQIAQHFGVDPAKLYLTKPTFFSRMTSAPPSTKHDEYWHKHIDKIQYGSFDYTSLIYLSTYNEDFEGGRFVFDDGKTNTTIEPRRGRVSFFTSGSENPHHVERVKKGTRYALTISFTCDQSQAITDPQM